MVKLVLAKINDDFYRKKLRGIDSDYVSNDKATPLKEKINFLSYGKNKFEGMFISNPHSNIKVYKNLNGYYVKKCYDISCYEEGLHEAVIGLELNFLNNSNFIKTYGYDDSLYLEYIHGENMSKYNFDKKNLISILIQIAFALYEAEEKLGFCHNDLHDNNIIISKVEEENMSYKYNGEEFLISNHGYKAIIVDLENATTNRFNHMEINYGVGYYGKSTTVVKDMFCLLVSLKSYKIVISLLKKIFFISDIESLCKEYKFFEHRYPINTGIPMEKIIRTLLDEY